jgi:hypothetical protein
VQALLVRALKDFVAVTVSANKVGVVVAGWLRCVVRLAGDAVRQLYRKAFSSWHAEDVCSVLQALLEEWLRGVKCLSWLLDEVWWWSVWAACMLS